MNAPLYRRMLLVFSLLFILTAACSLPIIPQQPTHTAQTQSVQTVDAMMTQVAGSAATATAGTGSTAEPIITALISTSTLAPSATVQPTATWNSQPSATLRPVCDQAAFIADISIPDGSVLTAGTPFIKTWRLKNIGSCTWTADYAAVYSSGDAMGGPASQTLGASVLPGQSIDISVPLTAPGQPGTYRGYWKLRNAAGVLFGLGAAGERYYVDVKVVSAPASGAGYDFAANLCLAQWTGNGKTLPCVGKDGTAEGFVLHKTRPVLENGAVDDEPALLTNPPYLTDGVIRGKYPAYTVKQGDRFLALLSCEYNAQKCNVRFQLDYQIDNGAIQTLGTWHEAYEGGYSTASVDLSGLAGKKVSFILTVLANGASEQDRALWLAPRIAPQLPTATPSATATSTATATVTTTVTDTATPTATVTLPAYP